MPRISKVTDTALHLQYGFLFDIQSATEISDWFDKVRLPKSKEEFSDALIAPDAAHATKGYAILAIAQIKQTRIVTALAELNTRLIDGMNRALHQAGRLFINANGGFFCWNAQLEVTETQTIATYKLPSQDIRIIQWPAGKHFYAKVGDQDVVVEGVQKWNTAAAARRAAEKFLEKVVS